MGLKYKNVNVLILNLFIIKRRDHVIELSMEYDSSVSFFMTTGKLWNISDTMLTELW